MDCIKIAEDTLQSHRKKLASIPEIMPVSWKGLKMTVEEAWAVVRAFEKQKASYLDWYNNTETGAGVTKTVFDGLSEATNTAGKGLKAFPLTAIVGDLVGGASKGIAGLGGAIGEVYVRLTKDGILL
jgi:hypothetical protein